MAEPRFTGAIKCGHCGNKTAMTIATTFNHVVFSNDETGITMGNSYEILQCPACEKVLLRKTEYEDDQDPDTWSVTILYPTASRAIPGLPNEIQREYEAAKLVAATSANAFGVLLGRVLDLVCKDQGADGDSLFERLNDLARKGAIPQRLVDMAHSLRQLRNVGAHADLGSLSTTQVPVLESVCRAILEYVYAAPALLNDVASRVKALESSKQT
jgi:hypothetical protein